MGKKTITIVLKEPIEGLVIEEVEDEDIRCTIFPYKECKKKARYSVTSLKPFHTTFLCEDCAKEVELDKWKESNVFLCRTLMRVKALDFDKK